MPILAMGGGGFEMEDEFSPIDDYLLSLSGRRQPGICYLPTPSGDLPGHIDRFYRAFTRRTCTPSHLPFFYRDERAGAVAIPDAASHLLTRDIVFVSGGNARAALAIWREWGLDSVLAAARDRGVLLAGMSAGAMCWFESALTDTYWESGYRPVSGLGFIKGGCRVHYSIEHRAQQERLHAALLAGAVPDTIAIDESAAVLFGDSGVERVVAWQKDAAAYAVSCSAGTVEETPYRAEWVGR